MTRLTWGQSLELRGRRVLLRPERPEDFDAWAEVRIRCAAWLTKWEPLPLPGQAEIDRHGFAVRCSARDRERPLGTAYAFGIFVGGRFAGEINLSSVQRGPFQSGYVGYWIDEALAGHGYMPESVVVLLRYSFEDLGLHRVQISIIPRNHASRRVVEKLGLRAEGVAERYLEINGVWEDHVRFAMTVEEWFERRSALLDAWVTRP